MSSAPARMSEVERSLRRHSTTGHGGPATDPLALLYTLPGLIGITATLAIAAAVPTLRRREERVAAS
jgi:hypothetical protein